MADPAVITDDLAGKVAKIMRLLASSSSGEVMAAVDALKRTLKNGGADLNDLADAIELSQATLQAAVQAGIEKANREIKQNGAGASHLQMPSGREMALWCYQHIDRLHDEKDREFVRSIVSWTRKREPTPRQQPWLEDVYIKTGGKL